MSSSMRNAIQRRNHKERSQPHERTKWGLLEKRKDYQQRSRDYNAKKATKRALAAVARERNPDEFYFAMTSSRTRDSGIRVAERPESGASRELTQDEVKLLKTQDQGYLRLKAGMERRKIEDLEGRLAFVAGEGERGKHTVYVEEEEQARRFKAVEFFDTHPDLVERGFNRPRLEQLAEGGFGEEEAASKVLGEVEGASRRKGSRKERAKMAKARLQAYKELEARMKREKDIKKLEREQELQRAKMGKDAPSAKNKWAKVRKR